jgi:hypothetical protein
MFVLNLVLLKVSEIDLMRGVVVCAVRRPLRLAQCGRLAGVRKATTWHGVGFHGVVTAFMARWRLPPHGDGQQWRWPTATASTARRRPAAASTSSNDFHVTAKASGNLTMAGSDLSLTGLNLGSEVFLFIFENWFFMSTDISQSILIMILSIS